MRVMSMIMMWIIIAHISNLIGWYSAKRAGRYSTARVSKRSSYQSAASLRALYCTSVQISTLPQSRAAARERRCTGAQASVGLETQQMLAPGQHLAQLRIVVRDQRALAQLIEEPA